MKITLKNDFHGSEVTLRVAGLPCELSAGQVRRARSVLCGISGCGCGGALGERGPQAVTVGYTAYGAIWLRDARGAES